MSEFAPSPRWMEGTKEGRNLWLQHNQLHPFFIPDSQASRLARLQLTALPTKALKDLLRRTIYPQYLSRLTGDEVHTWIWTSLCGDEVLHIFRIYTGETS